MQKLGQTMHTWDKLCTHPTETPEKIKYLINRIKPDVATGHDELSSRLIKAAGSAILEDLSTLINLSYETNTFPDQLKRARIKALHKKGGNNEPSQYRPIAILTIISKVFERSAVESQGRSQSKILFELILNCQKIVKIL